MAQHCHPGLEAGVALDPTRQGIADTALGELHVAERIGFLCTSRLRFELGDVSAFGDDDDAEQLAVAATPVQVADHLLESHLEFRDHDEVSAAGKASDERDPSGVSTHDLDDHDAVVC